MAISKELIESLDEGQQSDSLDVQTQPNAIPPNILLIVTEIMGDEILQHATLEWIQQKKREMTISKMRTLYPPERMDQLITKASSQDPDSGD